MKKVIVVLALLAVAILAECSLLKLESTALGNEVLIDGNDQEWEGNRFYSDKYEAVFGFQHDADNLYVLFISKDTALEHQMLAAGYTLWLNDQGKTKKTVGLTFPGMGRPARERVEESEDSRPDITDFVPEFLFLTDTDNEKLPLTPNQIEGFEFAHKTSDRGVVYEYKIPLHKTDNEVFGFLLDDDQKLAVGLICEAPDRESGERPEGERPERGRGRGSGMSSGGAPSGRGNGEMPDGASASKDYKIWVRVSLPTD